MNTSDLKSYPLNNEAENTEVLNKTTDVDVFHDVNPDDLKYALYVHTNKEYSSEITKHKSMEILDELEQIAFGLHNQLVFYKQQPIFQNILIETYFKYFKMENPESLGTLETFKIEMEAFQRSIRQKSLGLNPELEAQRDNQIKQFSKFKANQSVNSAA